jgi:outer membrane murein-binding lipoprotein Lpp
MVKKLSVLALAGMLALPTIGLAGGSGGEVVDLEKKIAELARQLDELRAAMAAQAEQNKALAENVQALDQNVGTLDQNVGQLDDNLAELDDRAGDWDLAARFKLFGDFRSRLDLYNADTVFGREVDNDTIWTNRFRLNMRVNATENVEFKGRLAMFKTWGNQSAFANEGNPLYPLFDGNVTRSPIGSSALYVDQAYINWNNVAGLPMWFSIGRRPTTDGPPAQLRLNVDDRMATPMAIMDWPFDGLTVGYAWDWGLEALGESRLRFCYGRGFEAGVQDGVDDLEDMDFAGFAWDVLQTDERLFFLQSYLAFDLINYPNFQDPIIDANFGQMSGMGDRTNLGDVWHSAGVYQAKYSNLNYFVAGGYSQTRPDSGGLFNDPFSPTGPNQDEENGYSLYLGLRYDIDSAGLKLGTEFNYGSQYWLAMAPGHDDIYQSKLATRGQVYEVYAIWDLPTGEAISKYAKTFVRLGYQHYEYDYSGSGDWNLYPFDLSDAGDRGKLQMMGIDPVESADQIYLTFEAYF